MRAQEIIAKKRDNHALSEDEISHFIEGVSSGDFTDYQTTALLMAIYLNGMSSDEQTFLTRAMLCSGEILDLSYIGRPVADKHSTGGIGDKTSLIIAPLAASAGLCVPMISGRGLGHTGGTLDKLESIPGFNVNLELSQFRKVLESVGFALIGQTSEIAPADRKIYALRDATSTVESIPLIVASIMSKKLAEGLDALVLDVKTGTGAFMQSMEESEMLATALVQTALKTGVKTSAIISDMNQPLGSAVGNALEVIECINILKGDVTDRTRPVLELSLALTSRMLLLTGLSSTLKEAVAKLKRVLDSGHALEKFRDCIASQKGDVKVCDNPGLLLSDQLEITEVRATSDGFVQKIDARRIGLAVTKIGGGRSKAEDSIDHSVGYLSEKFIGDKVNAGEVLGLLYSRSKDDRVASSLSEAYITGPEPVVKRELILKEIEGEG
jgi:pyrimidine-nucleoside phosphorylase